MTDESFGRFLKLSVRGASHAPQIRFELANFPADVAVDRAQLQAFMERRAPGRDALSTARRETDEVELVRRGNVIAGTVRNRDMRPGDYGAERTVPRPGHADFPQWVRFGRIPTGGGKNSGRLTVALCGAGGLCLQYLATRGISVAAEIVSVGGKTEKFESTVDRVRRAGDSVGGVIRCTVTGLRPGLGGALFDGLESWLSAGLFAIPGVKGVAFGNGFAAATLKGSENNDAFAVKNGAVTTASNRHGGLLGGFTSGMPVVFDVAMKPTPTVFLPQPSVDLKTMTAATCEMKGRHDPCIVRRAVPVVEAVAAFVIADAILADEAAHPRICLTLTGRTLEEDFAQFASQRYFADLVELRVDLLDARARARATEFPARLPVPTILTFRRKADGGAFDGAEKTRISFFRRALKGRFAYVDFESDFRVPALERLARKNGVRIVRSLHDFSGPVRNLPRACRALVGGTDEIAKVAFRPKSMADVARLLKETADFTDLPHVVCAMGPQGLASRVLAARTHSLWTYASVGGLDGIGHVSPEELVRTYRLRAVTREATLVGVTGWPLKATRSPEINNAAFAAADEEAVMVPYPSRTAKEAIAFMRSAGLKALAVTIPHKRAIIPLLTRLDKSARAVGAVNTVVREGEDLIGYNTDVEGFRQALEAFAARCGRDLASCRAAVLGDGGAAQAVKAALRASGVKFTVFHRQTPPPGYDLLVNATPVDPIPDYSFAGTELVYDLVYVPAETPLMARARAAGCSVENGFSMLVAQADLQRRRYGL